MAESKRISGSSKTEFTVWRSLTFQAAEVLALRSLGSLVDVVHPDGSGVAFAGSNPNCEANAPKSVPGILFKPSFGSWPIGFGLVGVGSVADDFRALCVAEDT
jgi:hypothetical protein